PGAGGRIPGPGGPAQHQRPLPPAAAAPVPGGAGGDPASGQQPGGAGGPDAPGLQSGGAGGARQAGAVASVSAQPAAEPGDRGRGPGVPAARTYGRYQSGLGDGPRAGRGPGPPAAGAAPGRGAIPNPQGSSGVLGNHRGRRISQGESG
ncbi:MAG: hypothetical protein ABSF44_16500, partial [Candidatus Bathyarchaeia archaeon]